MFCFFLSWLLLVLLVLFPSCCVSRPLLLLSGVLFYAVNESSSARFCSASFLSHTWTECGTSVCICAWYFLRSLTLAGTIMKRLLVVLFTSKENSSVDFFLLWLQTSVIPLNYKALPQRWGMGVHDRFCSYVINDEENEDRLSCTPLITFSPAPLCCRNDCTRTDVKQRRHSVSARENTVLNGWPSRFLIFHSPDFS